MDNDATYTISLYCNNCAKVAEYEITKGIRIHSVECENCGVKALKNAITLVTRVKSKKDFYDDENM